VQRRAVAAAGGGVARAEREVDRADDLLVEEDIAGEAGHARIGAEGELAEPPRTVVHAEERLQQFVVPPGARLDHPPALETQAHIGHFLAAVDGGVGVADRPVGRILDRAGEDLAAGHVLVAVIADPGAPGDGEG